MRIRTATVEDAFALARLNKHVHRLHVKEVPSFFTMPSTPQATAIFSKQLQDENALALIAGEGDTPIGYLLLYFREHPGGPSHTARRWIYIDQIGVLPEYQGQGVGRRLVDAALEVGRARGFDEVETEVWSFNERSKSFFLSLGLKPKSERLWMTIPEAGVSPVASEENQLSDESSYNWTDGRIRIRPPSPEDAALYYEAIQESSEEVSRWLPDLHAGLSKMDIQKWIAAQPGAMEEGNAYTFSIVNDADDALLGGCGLSQVNRRHRFANLFYWIRSSQTGQSVAPAAVRLLARFSFEVLGLQRVEIVVQVGNTRSIRVAEKAGAHCEGTLRNRLTTHGIAYDALMFSLVPDDLASDR